MFTFLSFLLCIFLICLDFGEPQPQNSEQSKHEILMLLNLMLVNSMLFTSVGWPNAKSQILHDIQLFVIDKFLLLK